MGRPLNKKHFGNKKTGGVGGQGVASVTVGGSWSGWDAATTTVTFSAPQLAGGVTATGTAVIAGGVVTGITITNAGGGYTAPPTVTITDSDGGAETTGTLTAVLTSGGDKAFAPFAYTGGSRKACDIVKQVSGFRYKVRTTDGLAICKLKAGAASAPGEMDLTATDANGSTYYVTKITAHKAVLKRNVMSGSFVHADGAVAQWRTTAASGTIVMIANV